MKQFVSVLGFLIIFYWADPAYAARLYGRISEKGGDAIPFANLFVMGSSMGTTANLEGYYSLELTPGSYEIIYRSIGYKQQTVKLIISGMDQELNISLEPETYQLKEVKIAANAEDPAYEIIRQAQRKRKFYLEEVDAYRCKAYVKSNQRLLSYPKTFFGQKVDMSPFIDTVTNIIYLSESVSDLSFRRPDRYKEHMISSKVSGNPQAYSFNQGSDMTLSLYENNIGVGNLTPRGIVSPISSNALFFYSYVLEGSFQESGEWIHKIRVTPKRKSDPVMTGHIYIVDKKWNFHSTDVFFTKEQQMEFIDTFRIQQTYIPVDGNIWMPFSSQYSFAFNVFGFKGNGEVLGIFTQYNLKPGFPKDFFDAQILKVESDANKKDSSYWETVRPVPLSPNEVVDYERKDSIREVRESAPYRDSVDKEVNKLTFAKIINGYRWQNTARRESVFLSSALQNFQFNTVEGWNTGISLRYQRLPWPEDLRSISIQPSLRYGFSNKHWNGDLDFKYQYNVRKSAYLKLQGGKNVFQINDQNPISELVNSMYSLWARKNYMKLYEKGFVLLEHRSQLFNGFDVKLKAEFAERKPLINTSDYSITSKSTRDYTANTAVHYDLREVEVAKHSLFRTEAEIKLRFRQEYIDRPEARFIRGSRYPSVFLTHRAGWTTSGSKTGFHYVQATIGDQLRLGLLGRLQYRVIAGDFLKGSDPSFTDFRHFNGNKTWFSAFRIDDFRNLEYYAYSASSAFLEAHAEHNFGGFLFNKVPLLRKLKLQEIAGFHFLHTRNSDAYFELTAGIEKLNLFRLELFTSVRDGQRGSIGFVFGIKRTLFVQ